MPKKYRLTVADLRSFRPARRLHGAHFLLQLAPSTRVQATVVVAKKVAQRAVDRNRIKRRARATIVPLLTTLSPAAYVFYAKKEALTATSAESRTDLMRLIEKARA